MKLIEKLRDCPDEQGWTNPNYSRAEKLEKIAEDFAIEFGEWYLRYLFGDSDEELTTKELLQIFKKEKQL
jgi:hypothetical protein